MFLDLSTFCVIVPFSHRYFPGLNGVIAPGVVITAEARHQHAPDLAPLRDAGAGGGAAS